MTTAVVVPQENPNDDEVTLVSWSVVDGESIQVGQTLALVETTKSTVDVDAPRSGFVRILAVAGAVVAVGATIAVITESTDEQFSIPAAPTIAPQSDSGPAEKIATKKAELIAKKHGLDVVAIATELALRRPLSEADMDDYIARSQPSASPKVERAVDRSPRRLLVVGGGYGATQLLDAASRDPHLLPVGIVDDNAVLRGSWILGTEVIGGTADAKLLWEQGRIDGVCISIGSSIPVRSRLFEQFRSDGIPLLNVVDPSAVISADVELGDGNFISALARIGPSAVIGDNNYLSSYVSIDHHSSMGDHCTFGPGVMTSGTVSIGSKVLFGTGIFIEPGVKIGDQCVIASGVTLTKSVPAGSTVKNRESSVIRTKSEGA